MSFHIDDSVSIIGTKHLHAFDIYWFRVQRIEYEGKKPVQVELAPISSPVSDDLNY